MGPLNSTTTAGPDRTISAEVERQECIARRVTELAQLAESVVGIFFGHNGGTELVSPGEEPVPANILARMEKANTSLDLNLDKIQRALNRLE